MIFTIQPPETARRTVAQMLEAVHEPSRFERRLAVAARAGVPIQFIVELDIPTLSERLAEITILDTLVAVFDQWHPAAQWFSAVRTQLIDIITALGERAALQRRLAIIAELKENAHEQA